MHQDKSVYTETIRCESYSKRAQFPHAPLACTAQIQELKNMFENASLLTGSNACSALSYPRLLYLAVRAIVSFVVPINVAEN